jgi:programmed cell death protein 5
MDNLTPTILNNNEIPDGFTSIDPNNPSSSRQQQLGSQQGQQEQIQAIIEQALSNDALARLRRIKLVKDTTQLERSIVSIAMSGTLSGPISEGKLIELLERTSMKNTAASAASIATTTSTVSNGLIQKQSGNISIQRKKCAFDSDDDDDNDDDL